MHGEPVVRPHEEEAAGPIQCTGEQLAFRVRGRRAFAGRCAGGRLRSAAEGLLLRETGQHLGLTPQVATCCGGHRHPASGESSVEALTAQHLDALARGSADLHDQAELRGAAGLPLVRARAIRRTRSGFAPAHAAPARPR